MEPGPRKLPSWLPQPGAGLKPSHCGLQISPAPCKVLAGTTVHTLLQSQRLRILSPLPPRTGGEQELTGSSETVQVLRLEPELPGLGEQELTGSPETVQVLRLEPELPGLAGNRSS